ncbi:DUF1517 domain-containing protein [Phormidium tenue FACHB-886]|nr:DUF1517 domain-containing protein [Phormidium tenue FACHB-886]
MDAWRDRFNRISGKTRITVCRIFVHLAGSEVAPLLGVLNSAARQAIDSEDEIEGSNLDILGEGLVDICQSLLQLDTYWQAAANEGDVFYEEGEAEAYVTELFTDSAQRYGSSLGNEAAEEPLTIPITQNVVVMITVAYEGEVRALETDLASLGALRAGLKAIINLHYDRKLRAIQVHYSPAQFGDELTDDELVLHYPELIPL